MLITDNIQNYGPGLWYLPQVFDQTTYRTVRRCYRETVTQWQCLTPNRLMSMPNNSDYQYLQEIAHNIKQEVSSIAGYAVEPHDQTIFVDLPGHQLTWHFDSNNYKVLLQVYCGDVAQPNMGTQWYVGNKNTELLAKHGTDSIVDVTGLPVVETAYAPNTGYINDNLQKKAHGTRRVAAGLSRESVLFTFI